MTPLAYVIPNLCLSVPAESCAVKLSQDGLEFLQEPDIDLATGNSLYCFLGLGSTPAYYTLKWKLKRFRDHHHVFPLWLSKHVYYLHILPLLPSSLPITTGNGADLRDPKCRWDEYSLTYQIPLLVRCRSLLYNVAMLINSVNQIQFLDTVLCIWQRPYL
jgi:hypothetical protein